MGIDDHIQQSIQKYKRHQEDVERQARAYLTEELQRLRDVIGNREFYAYRGRRIRWFGGDVSTAKEWQIKTDWESRLVGSVAFRGKSTSAESIGNGNVYLPEWDVSLGNDSINHSLDYDCLTRALDVVQNAADLGRISLEIPRGLHFPSDDGKLKRILRKYETFVESYRRGPTGK